MGGDLIDGVGGLAGLAPRAGMLAKAGSFAGKLVRPLSVVAGSIGLVDAIKNGDASDVGSAAGDVTGGLGGAMAGAAIGSMILPGIGTAIGGMIGGIGGGALGEWVGGKVGGWFGSDKTDIPASGAEEKQLTQLANASSTKQDNRQISVEVKIEPTGNPEYDQRMGEDVAQKTAMAVANVAPPDYDVALGTTLGDVS
jgi:phage tail tape-measure protein